ncbi:MAG: ABC transporter ATP-binding protein [Acidimicrobiales bacterium]
MSAPLLQIRDLGVEFKTKKGMAAAVRGVSFDVDRGQSVAVVGESGSGKSVTVMALMGLLPSSAQITGSAQFDGQELVGMPTKQLRPLRGRRIAMIFQDPMTAFNPVYTIGDQIVEALEAHGTAAGADAKRRATDLLEMVGVPEPAQRVDQYPHEFSGGMRQRAMIAMAISNSPDLLIADEPTTALDVTVQAQVMDVLSDIRAETGAAMILITHDLGLVAGSAEDVQVMYGGRIFEQGNVDDVFYEPANPYTRGLLSSMPRVDSLDERLTPIQGSPPSILNMPAGCAFAPRCQHREAICGETPADLLAVAEGHSSRCHRTDSLPAWRSAVAS